ncbi:hypothetical protein B0A48_04184 [Cryoendolithus antarcticus]|uniref:Alpha-L-rhamnosidase C-terminal domain-containing protein n=1 Tax=Cryoendolithus antarcticus TaxID=1507870 RepID=A0A1V8THM0_9PEZI|nr:hypothetical protein B0A48_04184 [Cryoendolithus antarcticus]
MAPLTQLKHLLLPIFALHASAFVDYGRVYPSSYAIGAAPTIDADTAYSKKQITLSPASPVLTIDYANEVAGFPFFDVASLSGPTQIEVKYSEEYDALLVPQSDGPWTFSNGLSNTFRRETFNLTSTGLTESYFVQGGQRWQTVRLLTSQPITFTSIGLRATSAHLAADKVPGQLRTSNPIYNGIWDLGARVVQAACIDAGNAPATWDITDQGALIRGQATAQSVKGQGFANYTMTFFTKIVRGGTGWKVAAGSTPYGATFVLTSNYPSDNTFLNTNRTLLPPSTLVFNWPWNIFNQTTVITGTNQYYPLSSPVPEGQWHKISTTISSAGYNGGRFGSGSATKGTFGFGPSEDQIAYFTNVTVAAANGTALYQNDLKSTATLAEYSVDSLGTSICLDGAKRDRLVWVGDFYHTSKVIPASSARFDYILGTIKYALDWQRTSPPYQGLVPISGYMGSRPEYKDLLTSVYGGLNDYQDLFLTSIGEYYRYTADLDGLRPYWTQIKNLVTARLAFIDPVSGLVAGTGASYFLGPVNGSAPTALFSATLRILVPIAKALNDDAAAALYTTTADDLNAALNAKLWNPQLGVYSLSLASPSNFSLTAIAWTILSGAANSSQAASMVAKMPELKLGIGYKTSSADVSSPDYELSPNTQGMLLDALFKAHRDLGVTSLTVAKGLLDDMWSKMVTQDVYYSGASWEYLNPVGKPGIQLFTSLAHPWGAAPTYVLPEYALGISPTSAGYKTFNFQPLLQGLDLTEVNGTVVTPYGNIHAEALQEPWFCLREAMRNAKDDSTTAVMFKCMAGDARTSISATEVKEDVTVYRQSWQIVVTAEKSLVPVELTITITA